MTVALGEHTLGLRRLTEAFPSLPPASGPLPTALTKSFCFFVFSLFFYLLLGLCHMACVISVP